jgi:alkyl sulfatase BDS1-like metallo-beta-lactamase superfamily hydrolase
MNNLKNKKNISLILLILTIGLFTFVVYFINNKIRNYKTEVLVDYNKFAELESEKKIFDTYKKILIKGSTESIKIKKHILSNDRKEVLSLINQFEDYTKKVSLVENNNSPIISVATRENALLSKYNAIDLVVNIKISGNESKINDFIDILNNLPIISYIEKIDMKFDNVSKKNNTGITLVIYQKK